MVAVEPAERPEQRVEAIEEGYREHEERESDHRAATILESFSRAHSPPPERPFAKLVETTIPVSIPELQARRRQRFCG